MSIDLHALFEPASVAVIGASRTRGHIGAEILHNLKSAGFPGRLIAVNPRATDIEGIETVASVASIEGHVDLAIVTVPCAAVPDTVDACLSKGVRALVVITAGFGETGPEGAAVERALVAKVRAAGVRMVGPNCLGLLNTNPTRPLNATFAPSFPPAGRVAMSTQSGALGLALLAYARQLRLGLSTFVSIGNKADLSSNDLLEYWADDPATDVVLLYLESFGNPRTFARRAASLSPRKPIVALKAGRSVAGARAAQSHTGALASSDVVVDAMFRQTGIIRAHTLEEFFGVATLLVHQPVPAGRRVAVLTNAGGPAIMAADALTAEGLTLPPLAQTTLDALRAVLPPAAGLVNPVDMMAAAPPETYAACVRALLADPAIDSLLVVYVPPLVSDPHAVARAVRGAVAPDERKTVIASFLGADDVADELGTIPTYAYPEAAAGALARASVYGEWRARARAAGPAEAPPDVAAAAGLLEQAARSATGWLPSAVVSAVLEAAGIPHLRSEFAASEVGARDAARRMGYPVVLKAVGADIVHKRDVGGVYLDLRTDEEVRRALDDLYTRLGTRLSAVLVQPFAPEGVEMLVGSHVDPVFGPVVACGLGGTLVELMRDVAVRLAPASAEDIAAMIDELKGAPLLRGFRGAAPADEGALRDVIARVSALAAASPALRELDLNPLMVTARGVRVVDARIRVAAPPSAGD